MTTATLRSGPRRVTSTDVLSIVWTWPPPAPGHHCHAKNCPQPCEPKRLCCARHWFMAPKELRDAVWATYRSGQERDKQPSAEWQAAAAAHLAAVWAKELAVIETFERALELAWPASENPLAWESFKSVAAELAKTATAALRLDFALAFEQETRTVRLTLAVREKGPDHRLGKARARAVS